MIGLGGLGSGMVHEVVTVGANMSAQAEKYDFYADATGKASEMALGSSE